MKHISITTAVLFTLAITLNGQVEKISWGKIPDDQLTMTTYEPDPEADAVILADMGQIIYDFRSEDPLTLMKHIRIKILTQAGIDQFGDAKISFYSFKNAQDVKGLKGRVYLPNGEKVNVGKDNIFREEDNKYWSSQTISFPSLEIGAVIEYKYSISSSRMLKPVDWFFQAEVPIVQTQLKIELPDWFDYVVLKQGRTLEIDNQRQDSRKITQISSNRSNNTSYSGNARNQTSTASMDVKFNTYEYAALNVPALKKEPFITTMDDYLSRVRFQLRSVNYPNQLRQNVFNGWDNLAMELKESDAFGRRYLGKRSGLKLLEAIGTERFADQKELEKATIVYDYIQNEIQWNELFGIAASNSTGEILKRKSGTTADMNLLLLGGLRQLGIEAWPLVSSTRSNGKMFELYPFLDQFNHTMVVARLDGQETLLDVSNVSRPIGLPRASALNYRGWLVHDVNPRWINIAAPLSSTTYFAKIKCAADGSMSGTVQGRFSGYHALKERVSHENNSDDYFNDRFAAGVGEVSTMDLELVGFENAYEKLVVKCSVSADGLGEENPELMYLTPLSANGLSENPFKAAERKYPIEYSYPQVEKTIVQIEIPDGYAIESLPENVQMSSEDRNLQYKMIISEANDAITIRTEMSLKRVKYNADEYEMLKTIYDQMIQKSGEQIVLKKKA